MDRDGRTPLYLAVDENKKECVFILLTAGAPLTVDSSYVHNTRRWIRETPKLDDKHCLCEGE
jgi:ankyrin repeat protein